MHIEKPEELYQAMLAIRVAVIYSKDEEAKVELKRAADFIMDVFHELTLSGESVVEADREQVIKTLLRLRNGSSKKPGA